MDWTSAPSIEVAPPEPAWRPKIARFFGDLRERLELRLEAERAHLAAWLVVAFAGGILAWFLLPGPRAWAGVAILAAAIALLGAVAGRRLGQLLLCGGLAALAGLGWIAVRNERVAAPVLERPLVTSFEARIERVEMRSAEGRVRLTLAPVDPALPPRVRVTYPIASAAPLAEHARIAVRARLQPPPAMMFPGGHDFARDAWFKGIGAVGRGLGEPRLIAPGTRPPMEHARRAIEQRITTRLEGGEAGIAIALATGTQAAIGEADAEAMRRSGLAHLLSVSGLHIAAVVGAAMFLSLRLLALSQTLALRFNLVLASAAIGAAAGIGYTLLTGMQVPTVRSCIAALLVLLGLAMGREAISMRLIAVGALVVLIALPEAIVGVSFQLSFAAVTAIVALHRSRFAERWLARREEGIAARLLRALAGLIATGLVVELALMPLSLYHFHKAGLYAVAANLVAIPWTTFVVMPLEFLALLAEPLGIAAPLWELVGRAIGLLLALAHRIGAMSGAVATLATMPPLALALMIGGGLWAALVSGPTRRLGALPIAIGIAWAWSAPVPDLLVSGDGRHVAIVAPDGRPLLLRERTGEFASDLVAETAGFDGKPGTWSALPGTRCSRDACMADIVRDGRAWRVLAIRSRHRVEWTELTKACASADLVIADRWLPRGCVPRWLKLDRPALERSGGVALYLGARPRIDSVARRVGDHPWRPLAPVGPLP